MRFTSGFADQDNIISAELGKINGSKFYKKGIREKRRIGNSAKGIQDGVHCMKPLERLLGITELLLRASGRLLYITQVKGSGRDEIPSILCI